MAKPPVKAKKTAAGGSPSAARLKKSKPAPKSSPAAKPTKSTVKNGAKAVKPAKGQPEAARKGKADAGVRAVAVKAKSAAEEPAKLKPVKKTRPDLANKILHMISEEMAIEEAELTPSASFKEDLNLDAIDVAELLMQAESNFGLHPFSEEEWGSCETVDDFLVLVQKRVDTHRGKKPSKTAKPGPKAGR